MSWRTKETGPQTVSASQADATEDRGTWPPPAGATGPTRPIRAGQGPGLAVRARGLTKTYGSGENRVAALRGVDVGFGSGAFTAIMGPSGSGKSTLMHLLAGLDSASAGQVWIGDTELTGMSDTRITRLRRERIGFVFQAFNLIPTLTARANIELPMTLARRRPDPDRFGQIVEKLGLTERLGHRPAEMSGGQQQRVAIARALLPAPDVVFADEPTGNLDSTAGAQVLGLLRASARETGQTVVMVTHDPVAASYADRVVLLADGRIAGDLSAPTTDGVLDALRGLGDRR